MSKGTYKVILFKAGIMQLRETYSYIVIWTNIVIPWRFLGEAEIVCFQLFWRIISKHFTEFKSKHQWWILLLQNDFVMGAFLWIPWSVSEQNFFRTRLHLKGCTKLTENETEAFPQGCSVRKLFWKVSQKFLAKHPWWSVFYIKYPTYLVKFFEIIV